MSHSPSRSHRSGDQISRSRECDKGVFVTVGEWGRSCSGWCGCSCCHCHFVRPVLPMPLLSGIVCTHLSLHSFVLALRVEHGYTAGRVFPHHTRTRVHRYPLRVAPVPYRNSCGVQRYLQYLRGFFFIISLRTNLIVY